MNQYPFPKNRWTTAAFWLFMFAMLLLARDTLFTSVIFGFYKAQFMMIALMGGLGAAFLFYNRRSVGKLLRDSRILLALYLALLPMLVMVIKRDWQMMYLSVLLCMIFPVFLTFFTDSARVAKCYVVLLTVLSAYSLLATYGFRHLIFQGMMGEPALRVNSAGMEFFDFILCFGVNDPCWHRNFGIFREPGVYQFFLILAIYLNHYEVQWEKEGTRWLVTTLLTVTMVSTYSIGGFAELAIFAVFLFFDKGYYRSKAGRWIAAGCVAAAVAVIVAALWLYEMKGFTNTPLFEVYDMLVRLTTDSDSAMDRCDALLTNAKFYLANPLVGAKIAPVLHGTNHNTSSTTILFSILGTFGGVLHLASWIAFLWRKQRNILGNMVLILVFLMSFNTQNLIADVFFWLFPCMALAERGLPLLKRKGI